MNMIGKICIAAMAASFALLNSANGKAEDLVLTSEVATTHWKTDYMNRFAKAVTDKTGGALTVKVFPASQLYNDQDAVAALGTGAVHMVWPLSPRFETIAAETSVINLPFGLSDKMMTNACFNKGITALMSSYVEPRNLKILGYLRASDMIFVFKDRDVNRMEDLAGAKIRVTGGRIFLDMMRKLSISPVSMPASEMSASLAQGAIDGIFTSAAGWVEMIGMTAKHEWYVPGFSLSTYGIVVDKGWFDGLPQAQRDAITGAIADISQHQWADAIEADKKLLKKMADQGATLRQAPAEEIARWQSLAKENNTAFSGSHPDVVRKVSELEKQCNVAN